MTPEQAQELWAEVKVNQETLTACVSHEFTPEGEGKFHSRYICKNCGGRVDGHAAHWYNLGQQHAKNRTD